MAILRIYVDTSVWNAALNDHAPLLKEQTNAFFSKMRASSSTRPYVSDIVLQELSKAPETRLRATADLIRESGAERRDFDEEAAALADAYIEHGVPTDGHIVDARHVAIATVAQLQVLVSWNYRHLVNRRRRDAFNGVNAIKGFRSIEIITPPEVFDE